MIKICLRQAKSRQIVRKTNRLIIHKANCETNYLGRHIQYNNQRPLPDEAIDNSETCFGIGKGWSSWTINKFTANQLFWSWWSCKLWPKKCRLDLCRQFLPIKSSIFTIKHLTLTQLVDDHKQIFYFNHHELDDQVTRAGELATLCFNVSGSWFFFHAAPAPDFFPKQPRLLVFFLSGSGSKGAEKKRLRLLTIAIG